MHVYPKALRQVARRRELLAFLELLRGDAATYLTGQLFESSPLCSLGGEESWRGKRGSWSPRRAILAGQLAGLLRRR